jgi:hypothetical protein
MVHVPAWFGGRIGYGYINIVACFHQASRSSVYPQQNGSRSPQQTLAAHVADGIGLWGWGLGEGGGGTEGGNSACYHELSTGVAEACC